MTIKTLVFSAHRRVSERLGARLPRSHVYEALAAAFGFASYAALCASSVFDSGRPSRPDSARRNQVSLRLLQLGFDAAFAAQIASELEETISEHGLHVVDMDEIIDSRLPELPEPIDLDTDDNDSDDYFENLAEYEEDLPLDTDGGFWHWRDSDFLMSGLEESAHRGNAKAHYALALLLREDEQTPVGSSYWYDRQQQGEALNGAHLDWAEEHRLRLEAGARREQHLREASRLGHPDACVDAAQEFDDPAFLMRIGDAAVRDPAYASEVAAELGRTDLARRWCAAAAAAGDIPSIRQMVEHFDRADLPKRWTWVHFSRLIGRDITRDDYRLVNEDGSEYDDDVGGPAYPVGVDGISLPELDPAQDALAQQEAHAMLRRASKRK